MAVAADRPPIKATSVDQSEPAESGSVSTNMSLSMPPAGKVSDAGDRDRHHEQIDQDQIDRKHPRRARTSDSPWFSTTVTWNCRGSSTMAKVESSVIATSVPSDAAVQIAAVSGSSSACAKQRDRAVEHPESDEDADRREGHQLDHGFRGDREHQAVLMFGGVDVTGAEQHGEGRHRQRDEQRDVAERNGTSARSAPVCARMVPSDDDTAFSCSAI